MRPRNTTWLRTALAVAAAAVMLAQLTPASAADKGTVTIAYVEWDSCVAGTDMVKYALEDAGYKVKTESVSAALMYEGLANNDVDAMVCAWLPKVHAAYYAKTKDRLDNLGPNMANTRIGLVVPDYVTIDSIADLAKPGIAKKFDNRIVGIDPGAGIMEATDKAIPAYKLPEKLVSGSDATMTAVLGNEIRQKKWVVVTGWTPHWMWSRWQLKFLDDPKDIYGKPGSVDTLVRKGLKKDMPQAWAILNRFHRTDKDTDAIMDAGERKGASIHEAAKKWVEAHPQQVNEWLGK
ncbi:MAG TPA: glycine betaine ABC transporter substrate-binding protein [Nevskiaceae bacterium]